MPVSSRVTPPKNLQPQIPAVQVGFIDIGDLQFDPEAGLEAKGADHRGIVVNLEDRPSDGRSRSGRLLLNVQDPAVGVEFNHLSGSLIR